MKRFWALLVFAAIAGGQDEPEAAFRVAGQVVDAQGKPRAGALVSLWDALNPERFLGKIETNALGKFAVDVAPETAQKREHAFGSVFVEVKGSGVAQARVDARAGATDLKIKTVAGKEFEGLVETADGKPYPAAVVRARRGRVTEKTTTDENGRFVLTQFAKVPRVTVVGEGFLLRAMSMNVRMPEVRMVTCRLVDESGNPVAGARVRNGPRDIAVTDDNGVYRVPIAKPGPGVVQARYRLHARGFAAAWLNPFAKEERVAAAEPLRGVVMNDSRKVVPNARVSIGADFVAWTGPLGGFRFDSLPRGMVDLEAAAPGYLPAKVRVEAGIAADRITLRLIEGDRIEGRVMRAGQPAMGAWVTAYAGKDAVASAYSDGKGRFLLAGIPPGVTHLMAGERHRLSVKTPLKDGVTLDLEESMRMFGVLKSDSGEPLADTKVAYWVDGELKKPREVVTDAEGRFDFGVVPVRHYAIASMPSRHETMRASAYPGEPLELTATSHFGNEEFVVWARALGDPRVVITLHRREAPRVRRVSRTNGGTFRGLPAGTYDLTVQAEGHLEEKLVVEVGKEVKRTVTMRRAGTLELLATPGAKVIVQTVAGKPAPVIVMELAAGRKTVRGFGPGEYRFIARAKGELIVVRRIKLGPNAPPQQLDLRGGKESALTVTVLDRAGDAVVGAKVVIETEGFRAPPKRTDEHGKSTLTRLFAGRIRVTASHGELAATQEIDVRPGKQLEIELTLG